MKIYLFPFYVSLYSAGLHAPRLFKFLKERGIELEAEDWDGTLESLPTDGPAIVRASSRIKAEASSQTREAYIAQLARRCAELGHFFFYDDQVILADGTYNREQLLEEAARFLDKAAVAKVV